MAKLEGVSEFLKVIDYTLITRKTLDVVKQNGAELTNLMKGNANFRGHYDRKGNFIKPTGATKRSIAMVMGDYGFSVAVGPGTLYSEYLEYGTRYMAAQPFIFKSLDTQEPIFLKDLLKVVGGDK